MSEGELAVVVDERLTVVMMVRSNLEPLKPLLQEEENRYTKRKLLTLKDEKYFGNYNIKGQSLTKHKYHGQ